ncbi:transposase [Photobacterium leiognathi]|nr:transposase [Photobacterium leiognathi]
MYAVEKKSKNLSPDELYKLRQKDAIQILTTFYAWLEKPTSNLLTKSPMGTAIDYALKQWLYLKNTLRMAGTQSITIGLNATTA